MQPPAVTVCRPGLPPPDGCESSRMPVGHHVRLRARDDRVVAPSPAERRVLARTVLEHGRECRLLTFRAADTHSHAEVACSREAAGEFARRVSISLTLRLGVECGFQPAWIGPIHDQRHLLATFWYILRQRDHHGLESDPWHEGSNLPDLLGLRPLGVYTAANVRELLPRVHRGELIEVLGDDLTGPIDVDSLADAAAAAACLPDVSGNGPLATAARAAATQAVDATSDRAARLLGVSTRTVRRLRGMKVPAELVQAVARQLSLRGARP